MPSHLLLASQIFSCEVPAKLSLCWKKSLLLGCLWSVWGQSVSRTRRPSGPAPWRFTHVTEQRSPTIKSILSPGRRVEFNGNDYRQWGEKSPFTEWLRFSMTSAVKLYPLSLLSFETLSSLTWILRSLHAAPLPTWSLTLLWQMETREMALGGHFSSQKKFWVWC